MAPQVRGLMRRPLSFPTSSVMGRRKGRVPDVAGFEEHPSVWIAFDHWVRKRRCGYCETCVEMTRVSRLRRMYGGRR